MGYKLTPDSYKLQYKRRLSEFGVGDVLSRVGDIEQLCVLNDFQFMKFYNRAHGWDIPIPDSLSHEEISHLRMNAIKFLLFDLYSDIEGGVYIADPEKKERVYLND